MERDKWLSSLPPASRPRLPLGTHVSVPVGGVGSWRSCWHLAWQERNRREGARRLSGCVTELVLRAAELPVLSWCVAGCVLGGLPGAEGLAGAGCGDGTGQRDQVWSVPGCGGSPGAMRGAGSLLLAQQHVLVPRGFRGDQIPQHEQL